METFTDQEKKILEPFVSNTDKNVFALTNLPEVVKGALFSRYSRSPKSLRRLLIDEFLNSTEINLKELTTTQSERIAVQKAQDFYDRILDGYGDDSVGELGGAHVACENISMIAAKFIENQRIGGSPLEKSTRYVWFNSKQNGDYLFYKEPRIMKSKHANKYLATNRMLFDTYSRLMEPMTKHIEESLPIQEFSFFDPMSKENIQFLRINDEKIKRRALAAYNASVRANACDALRCLLPASTLTNVGIFGNGRFFQNLLTNMHTDSLTEINEIATSMHEELNKTIPSFVKRAKFSEYKNSTRKAMQNISKRILEGEHIEKAEDVTMAHYDKEAEIHAIAAMLYSHSNLPMEQLIGKIRMSSTEDVKSLIETYFGNRQSRRDKPGRAIEHIYYTFDMLTDFGIYRDLQRHRIMTQERQMLTTKHGYTIPAEIAKAGFKEEFESCMKEAEEAHGQISQDLPSEAQYIIPMAYKVRWYAKLNLREAFHLIELRTTPQGHQSYRKIAQEMFKKIKKAHPSLAYYMKFADMNEYPLGRISAELKSEEKREFLSSNNSKNNRGNS